MDWNPSDTVTVGSIFVGFMFLFLALVKMVGQRTDPLLANALQSVIDSNSKVTTANEKSDERWAAILEKNTTVMEAMRGRIETSENNALTRQTEMLEAWRSFRDAEKREHSAAYNAILEISPKIDELTQAQTANEKQSEGIVKVVDKAITNQDKLLREIYAAILRLEASVAEYKIDSAEKAEKMQQDINVVKADLVKVSTPIPTVTIEPNSIEAKPKQEKTE